MFRIDSPATSAALAAPAAPGPTVGYFTEGDPVNSIPATIVSADWLNTIQEELIAVLVLAGVTPAKATRTQLRDAIVLIAEERASIPTFALLNNQVNTDLTGLVFDSAKYRAVEIGYEIYRKDAGNELVAIGKMSFAYKPVLGIWILIGNDFAGEDTGTDLSVSTVGQVKYSTSNMGASYVGEFRAKTVKFKI